MIHLCDMFPTFPVPAFLSALEHDLNGITQFELSHARAVDALQKGHGLVKQYVEGPTIFFRLASIVAGSLSEDEETQVNLLSQRLEPNADDVYSARISLEFGPIEGFAMSKDSTIESLSQPIAFKPIPAATVENMPQPAVNFMLVLNRPVAVTTAAARRILKITHGGAVASLGLSTSINAAMHDDAKNMNEGYPLLNLLASTGFIPQPLASTEASPILMESIIDIDMDLFTGLPNAATSAKNQRLFYARGPQPSSILIQRIPFVHISQLHPILQILRQQISMAELFKSCFNPAVLAPISKSQSSRKRKRDMDSKPQQDQARAGIDVEVASSAKGADTLLHLLFTLPSVHSTSEDLSKKIKTEEGQSGVVIGGNTPRTAFSAAVEIAPGGELAVQILSNGARVPDMEKSFKTLLDASHSVPLTLLHVVSRMGV
jgi:hypothetical protein